MQKKKEHPRLLVVGDVHGHFDKLEQVLDKAGFKAGKDGLVFLGDYVDRGPQSREVLECVSRLVAEGATALLGNHEAMMLDAMQGALKGNVNPASLEHWFANGGEATLRSYKDDRASLAAHLAFLQTLPLIHTQDGYIFVHAGLRPGVSVDNQKESDLLWIREEYIEKYQGPWRVVTGHTPTQYLTRMRLSDTIDAQKPVVRKYQIFMDTGAAWRGKLSVMDLLSGNIWQA